MSCDSSGQQLLEITSVSGWPAYEAVKITDLVFLKSPGFSLQSSTNDVPDLKTPSAHPILYFLWNIMTSIRTKLRYDFQLMAFLR